MGDASREMLERARRTIPEWRPSEAERHIRNDDGLMVVDVREQIEWNDGHIPDAVHVPRGYLELQVEEKIPDKSTPILLYCAGGVRSLLAGQTLQAMGYDNVISLAGGYGSWTASGLPTVTPLSLTDSQRRRYSRHL